MSSLGIFDKETKTYKKVADLSKPAVIDSAMSDTSTNTVQNKVVKKYVDDRTVVDSVMSDSSNKAVQNKVVKSYVDGRTTLDTSMSDTSTNAVQNKVVKSYVDGTFKQKLITAKLGDSETPYLRLCTIKINGPWINYPIEITVQERGRDTLDRLTVIFETTNYIDPNITSFKVFGEFTGWYISKTAASTWTIYGEKSETWAEIRVIDYIGFENVNVTWDVTGVTSLPDSKTQAVFGGNVSHAVSADIANSALTVTNVDAAMSDTSTNPVQNKVIKSYVDGTQTGYYVGSNPPTNKNILWIDSLHGGMVKYFASDTSKWHPVRAKGYDTPVDLINERYWSYQLGPGIRVDNISAIYDINTDKVTITIKNLSITDDAFTGPNDMVDIYMPMYNLGHSGTIKPVTVRPVSGSPIDMQMVLDYPHGRIQTGPPYGIYKPATMQTVKFEVSHIH